MDVSILIVNYNTSQLLLNCVCSICREVKHVEYEIIVADNCSTEEEKALLRGDSRFRLLELPQNLGFGKANNEAAKQAQGKYLFLLNPDTILLNDAVTILYQYMEDHSETGICGGNLYDERMLPTHSYHRIFPSLLSEFDFATGQVYRYLRFGKNGQFNHTAHPLNVAMITGADLMISSEVWERLEGFSPEYFMYCEDADLCFRCQKQGYSIVSVPDARIQHLEGQSFMESESRCRRILDGRFRFFYKHYGPVYNNVTNGMNILSLAVAVVICKIFKKKAAILNYSQRLRIYREFTTKSNSFSL